MKTNKIIAVLIIVIALAAAFLILSRNRNKESLPQANVPLPETKVDSQGEVTVVVTPPDFSGRDSIWRFKVVLDTHSVELIDDLAKNATLIIDNRNEYQPLGWEGDGPGGHHRQGDLLFGSFKREPENVILEFKNIGNVLSRRFQWSLKK